jgi:hypothetical protein
VGVVGGISRHGHILDKRAGRHASARRRPSADRASSHLRCAGARRERNLGSVVVCAAEAFPLVEHMTAHGRDLIACVLY